MMRIPCSRGPLSRALFRPFARARRYSALQTPAPAAVAPPSTEETDTDVALAVHPNVFKTTGALWVSGVLPLKLSRVDVRHLFVPDSRRSLREIAEKSIVPSGIFERGFGILEVIPAPKEGGMVLRYGYNGSREQLQQIVHSHLQKTHVKTWYNWNDIEAYPIKGVPFIEDLLQRHPSPWLKVDFKGPPLPIESLFNLFRPYGRLVDIQPSSDGKSAKIIYLRATSAVSAQNCLLGYKEGETTLSVEYMDPDIVGKWMSWFQKNTRLAILLAGALVALISFLILEPTRRFLIANKVTKTYTPTGLFKYIYSLLRLHTTFSFLRPRGPNLASEGLEEVRAYADRIIESCKNVPDTFVFIIGPKGSGKATLVRQLQDHASYDLSLDMDAIQSQSSDALVLRQLTKQIGYWPQFTFFARFNAMADALIQATTGTAAGLSSTPQQDFKGFLETATVALKQIVADQVAANAKLEAQGKPTKMVEYPVIIINGFAGKERANGKNGWTNDLVAEWAATLIENKVANVVFTTKNPRSVRVAAKFLPTKSLDLYTLHDASYEKSYSYISGQLTPPLPPDADPALPPPSSAASSIDPAVLKEILVGLGGRLTDMDLLAQKIKAASMVAGENGKMPEITTELVRDCYEDLVTRVIAEVRKAGFGDTPDEAAKMGWTPVQFWFLVKRLAANDSVSYDEVKNSVPFGRKDAPLFAMEDAELISLEYERGRPFRIRVGRPIARIAFREMVGGDPRFAAGMSVRECEEAIQSIVEKQIVPAEEELARLQAIVSGTGQGGGLMGYLGLKERRGLQERVGQLSSAIGGATAQIEKLNEEKGKWKSLM